MNIRKNINEENKDSYYYSNDKRIPLFKESRVYALRFERGRDSRNANFSRPSFRFVKEESNNAGFIPNYGLHIYQVQVSELDVPANRGEQEEEIVSKIKKLGREEAVKFAAGAFRRKPEASAPEVGDLMFVTNEFLVQFKAEISRLDIDKMNDRYGVRIISELNYAPNGYLLEAPEAEGERGPVALSNIYFESGKTKFAHPDFIRRRSLRNGAKPSTERVERGIEDAEFLPNQWHLQTTKVIDAWTINTGNPNIKIAILDDGVDTSHQEFTGKISDQFDFASNNNNGSPNSNRDNHGTACAGVAVAKGVKAPGAAPNCSLIAVRYPDFLGVAAEGNMFRWTADQGADVISCSWGPTDGTGAVDPLPDNVRAAINYCVTQGRNGKGVPIFWAAGNGNESVSNDGYASNPDVMAVAASTSRETRAHYSDFGPEIFICAPSSGRGSLGERRIFTTDRLGAAGYNPDSSGVGSPSSDFSYTDDFGGTSSSTPLVAGIVGLMLSANPNLSLQNVRAILKDTAEKIDQTQGNYNNGRSNWYGYGRIDALRAVQAAQNFSGNNNPNSLSIKGPANLHSNAGPPTFEISKGGRNLYAVEVATRSNLFNSAAHGSERNANNFFGSWQNGLLSNTPYTLPQNIWDLIKTADRIYYRLHVGDDLSWSNYDVTTSDSNSSAAPSITIAAEQSGGSGPIVTPGDEPSINGPLEVDRESPSPTFQINKGGRQLYAVEVAAQAELFNSSSFGSQRNSDNFYGSWEDQLETKSNYTLPNEVWNRLKGAERLYYRLHVGDDESWTNHSVSVPDAAASSAPSFRITGATVSVANKISYPSGISFNIVQNPQGSINYDDHVGNEAIPLVEVKGREEEKLSANFKVKELMASDNARYARISPQLVEGLQRLRDRLGAPITVIAGYRHPNLNTSVGGVKNSQHIAGRAADVKSSSAAPLELARMALEEIGCEIGLGLGRTNIHIDLRGRQASWTYKGAELSESEFDQWVQNTCRQLDRKRTEPTKTYPFQIIGPEQLAAREDPPSFYIDLKPGHYYAVEFAKHPDLFHPEFAQKRKPDNYYASWNREGLLPCPKGQTMYVMKNDVWEKLNKNKKIYYRLLSSSHAGHWADIKDSLDQNIEDAPWVIVVQEDKDRTATDGEIILPINLLKTQQRDESLWREPIG